MKNEELRFKDEEQPDENSSFPEHSEGTLHSSLKEKTAKGLFWGGLSNGIQQLLNLFFGIFLARLLTQEDYGMVGVWLRTTSATIIRRLRGSLLASIPRAEDLRII